jgi:hypothetical protein
MDATLALVVLILAVLLAFPLFSISAKLSRNRRANPDPKLQTEADGVFEAELKDDDSGAAS